MTAFHLGLTGSIGMGKSATAALFRAHGVPVWDADATVHALYSPGGAAVGPLSALHPAALVAGGIDRAALKAWIAADPSALAAIERVVHPLVAADRARFGQNSDADLVVFDIPLLFENGSDAQMDATLLVTAPPDVQRARVLARPGMTPAHLDTILARQMPDREKRARATHILETLSPELAARYVADLIAHIRGQHA